MKKQILILSMFFLGFTFVACKKTITETSKPSETNALNPNVKTDVVGDDNTDERFIDLTGSNGVLAKVSQLNVNKFGQAMHKSLKDSVTGYVLQLTQNGTPIYNLKWNWAQTPADAAQGWDFNTRMHVASVSKYLTALGLMKALKMKGISYDAKIVNYLPAYWIKGFNINQISFRNLLTHTSGFSTNSSSSDYAFMKFEVMIGVPMVGSYDYENMNFGLMRILIPVIMGYMSKDLQLADALWDQQTITWYRSFMQANVFTPSGVSNVDFTPSQLTKNALAYKFPHNNNDGWNSGNLASVSGGAGWRLSVSELLKIMDHARRKGDILPAADVQYGLDNNLGIDQVINTSIGKMYNKNGAWGNGNGDTEQSVIYFFPNNMELAVLVNSPIGKSSRSLRDIVKNNFNASLE